MLTLRPHWWISGNKKGRLSDLVVYFFCSTKGFTSILLIIKQPTTPMCQALLIEVFLVLCSFE
ncbi:hypothetical protein DQK03_15005 [Salmonella enterica subsp. enterica serovar Altona]|nr:hypothetical protein [Salmonella enterica subsp. enterica serovar Emek]EAN0049948.1 hypothetical protein [Salmonella enterica]EBS4607677.1 hypothetical protein [Salmonella enterica subsp. enterica serovar Altona]ECA8324660.1 hypothetical protein [Salmonella enterica subsp. enterica serovar Emek]MJA72397.1 hypothetical protein [Salmonella enterica subsp. enterica serovar Albany]